MSRYMEEDYLEYGLELMNRHRRLWKKTEQEEALNSQINQTEDCSQGKNTYLPIRDFVFFRETPAEQRQEIYTAFRKQFQKKEVK